MKRIAVLLALCLIAGCKPSTTNPATLAPGADNQFDQDTYQALMTVQASLLNLQATLLNPNTSAETESVLKPYFNQASTDYDLAVIAWKAYHTAAASDPNTSTAAAQAALSRVQTDIQNTPKVTK